MDKPKRYLPDPEVCQRYGVSDMTITRWTQDPRLNFPQPLIIRSRKYRDLDELEDSRSARPRIPDHGVEASRLRRGHR